MPSTQPYGPTFDFGSDPDPQQMVNAEALSTQFDLIAKNLSDLIAALSVAIRDDNTLTDELVRLRNLHPELMTYLDSRLSGSVLTQALDYKYPVRTVLVTNLVSFYGLQTLNGVSLVEGDRVLLVGQSVADQNGIWVVHDYGGPVPSGLWTRADDLPAGSPSGKGWAVITREGTDYLNTAWAILAGGEDTEQPVVGTDALTFFQVFAPVPMPVNRGGTGATTAAGARANLGASGKWTGTITGNGVLLTFTVTHNLGTTEVLTGVRDSLGRAEGVDDRAISPTQVQLTFTTPPAVGEVLTVTVIG